MFIQSLVRCLENKLVALMKDNCNYWIHKSQVSEIERRNLHVSEIDWA